MRKFSGSSHAASSGARYVCTMRSWIGVVAAVAIAATSPAAWAVERRVTFAETIAAADRNPRVVADARAAQELATAQQEAPRLDQNPTVTAVAGSRVAPSSERGFEGALGLSQSVSLEGSAGKRREALGAEATWLREETSADRLSRRLAAAGAWMALWEAEHQMAVVERDQRNEEELLRLVERLARAHERTTADVAMVDGRLAEAQVRARSAEGALAEARSLLEAELGVATRGEKLVADGALPDAAAFDETEKHRIRISVANLPSVRAKTLLARAELVRAQEERAMRSTRLTAGIALSRDAPSATIVQGTVSIPLPLFAVGAREYAARHANSVRLDGEAEDELVRARASIELAIHEVEHTEEVYALLSTRLLPAAERTVALRQRELTAGAGTLIEICDARRTLFDASTRAIRASRERAWARIRIELLSGAVRNATREAP